MTTNAAKTLATLLTVTTALLEPTHTVESLSDLQHMLETSPAKLISDCPKEEEYALQASIWFTHIFTMKQALSV